MMANDLEKFLQQAAERLRQSIEQGQAPRPAPPRQQPVRQAERARPKFDPEIVDAEVIEPQTVRPVSRPLTSQSPNPSSLNPRSAGPDPLSNLDTLPQLAQEIGMSDERMAEHVHEVFDHSVSTLPSEKAAGGTANDRAGVQTEVKHRQKDVSPLIEMLRKPDTLRAAFIASEIFGRKFK